MHIHARLDIVEHNIADLNPRQRVPCRYDGRAFCKLQPVSFSRGSRGHRIEDVLMQRDCGLIAGVENKRDIRLTNLGEHNRKMVA